MIPKYSLKKNPTNSPLENSVLNLETSSDSPSIRSIGVRPTSHEKIKYVINTTNTTLGTISNTSNNTISYPHASTTNRNPPIFE